MTTVTAEMLTGDETARLNKLTICLDQIMDKLSELTKSALPDAEVLKNLQTQARMSASLIRQYLKLEALRGAFCKRHEDGIEPAQSARKTDQSKNPQAVIAATEKTLTTAKKNKSKLKRRLQNGLGSGSGKTPLPGLPQPAPPTA